MRRVHTILAAFILLSSCQSTSGTTDVPEETTTLLSPRTVWAASAILRSLEGQTGNGFVESQYLEDNTFVHTMRVNLLPQKMGGYEAWLVREDPPDVISLGMLENPAGDGLYFLKTQEAGDFRSHNKIVVTWEPEGDTNPSPEDPVVEGVLKVVQRAN